MMMRMSCIAAFALAVLATADRASAQGMPAAKPAIGGPAKTIETKSLEAATTKRVMKNDAAGILVEARDGSILVKRSVTPDEAAKLTQLGFRAVSRQQDIAPKTIYNGELYTRYYIAANGPSQHELERLIGSKIGFEMVRGQDGVRIISVHAVP